MPFRFLLYLQPVRYFSVPRANGNYIYPKAESIPENILEKLATSSKYTSKLATEYDLSWQAIHIGFVKGATFYNTFEKLPIKDEYVFLRSYFRPIWSLYVLLIRLVSFKNPFAEIGAFFYAQDVKKQQLTNNAIERGAFENFESKLVGNNPLVSVIIPTLNRYEYLKDVLKDLEKQTYTHFEVIVVDQSDDFSEGFYAPFNLKINLVYQEEKALWLARNTAIEVSKGEFLLFFDDDSRVETNWIFQHLKCLDYFNAEGSSGVSLSTVGAKVPENYSFFRIADQLDTGNVLLKKDVFRKIGLYDRQFEKQRMGDGEFGMRMYKHGFTNISNPRASRLHLKVGTGGLRHMGSWDAFRTQKLFAPRPIPSVLYFYRRYFGKKRSWFALLKTIPPSIVPYRFKKSRKLKLLGIFVSIFLLPIIGVQVLISWRKATQKLKQGPQIRALN
ncbi:glycosyltransferase family 2 protein [Marinirhabdus gelatinilytica]|uniref:GT2 family glycosyltransferase n=1 Tax=Marinirhabdus gelatinilytica TaxID=1703343 RepID=A0A370Q8Z4_9FLAO|nr:glycosyltransferase family A protein [Marinirhabdus gelatinilytica]RDK84826.1 GT2 family glycosyltransferase [Marinirhabdus gelatinilytica]